jgi:hypothetical protein
MSNQPEGTTIRDIEGSRADKFAAFYEIKREPGETDDDLLNRVYARIHELGD